MTQQLCKQLDPPPHGRWKRTETATKRGLLRATLTRDRGHTRTQEYDKHPARDIRVKSGIPLYPAPLNRITLL